MKLSPQLLENLVRGRVDLRELHNLSLRVTYERRAHPRTAKDAVRLRVTLHDEEGGELAELWAGTLARGSSVTLLNLENVLNVSISMSHDAPPGWRTVACPHCACPIFVPRPTAYYESARMQSRDVDDPRRLEELRQRVGHKTCHHCGGDVTYPAP